MEKVSQFQFKFIIIYFISYFQDFIQETQAYINNMNGFTQQEIVSMDEVFKPYPNTDYDNFKPIFSIQVMSNLFYSKLGKFPESIMILKLCNFKADPEDEPIYLTLEKTSQNMSEINGHLRNF